MTYIRISSGLAMLAKLTKASSPAGVFILSSAFYGFVYAAGKQRVQVANLTSPGVGASLYMVLIYLNYI